MGSFARLCGALIFLGVARNVSAQNPPPPPPPEPSDLPRGWTLASVTMNGDDVTDTAWKLLPVPTCPDSK